MKFSYEYPRAALTVDCVVFGLDDEDLQVLLIQRDLPPFEGKWALPGGFVRLVETLEEAARRELQEETGIENVYLEQLYTIGELDRDPRERVVTVAYYALVKLSDHRVQAATDARNAAWFAVDDVPPLAFDHERILSMAHERLRGKVRSDSSCCRQSSRYGRFSICMKSCWTGRSTSEIFGRRSSAWIFWSNSTKSRPTSRTALPGSTNSTAESTNG